MKNIIFYLGMGTLFTHELDAMFNHEWRILPLTSWLPEETAMLAYLFFHIPLFAGLIALVASKKDQVRVRTRIGISVFLLFHAGLHGLFSGNPASEFSSLSSSILIYGGALLGSFHLLLEYIDYRSDHKA